MFRPRISNCFTFLPPCLMSKFGYTAVSNLSFILGAGKNDWRASCRTRPVGACFYANVRSEFFTPRGDENRRASRAVAFRAVAISAGFGASAT
jgi:hypothetical protein